ncbi:hypothetical protein ACWNT8_02475 [Pigmentibacter ruber]
MFCNKTLFISLFGLSMSTFYSCGPSKTPSSNRGDSDKQLSYIKVGLNSDSNWLNNKTLNEIEEYRIEVNVNCGLHNVKHYVTEKDPRIPIENGKDCSFIFEKFTLTRQDNKLELNPIKKLNLQYNNSSKSINKSIEDGKYSNPDNSLSKKVNGLTKVNKLEIYITDDNIIANQSVKVDVISNMNALLFNLSRHEFLPLIVKDELVLINDEYAKNFTISINNNPLKIHEDKIKIFNMVWSDNSSCKIISEENSENIFTKVTEYFKNGNKILMPNLTDLELEKAFNSTHAKNCSVVTLGQTGNWNGFSKSKQFIILKNSAPKGEAATYSVGMVNEGH